MTAGSNNASGSVLIVEDVDALARGLRMVLEDAGYDAKHIAHSVSEAKDVLSNGGWKIDAAVLDINIGSEKVYPVAEELRKRNVPFVFCTSVSPRDVDPSFRDVPVVAKPLEPEDVVQAVQAIVQDHLESGWSAGASRR